MRILLALILAISYTANIRAAEQSISLAGMWHFSRDHNNVGITDKWYASNLQTEGSGPKEIMLPGSTDQAKAGISNSAKPTLDGLYRPNIYTGPAWYQRDVVIPSPWKGKHVTLFLERNHWVTHVWIDGTPLGSQDSLISPQLYDLGVDLAPGRHQLTICEDNTLIYNLGQFVSITYDGTQTNWNGIVGRIALEASDPESISDVQIYPDVDRKLIKVVTSLYNQYSTWKAFSATPKISGTLQLLVSDSTAPVAGASASAPFTMYASGTSVTLEVPMGDHCKLWDEFHPNLYKLAVSMQTTGLTQYSSRKEITFGMRDFAAHGTQFTMNGRTLMLRGTLDCAIYPLTGFPPTDVQSWKRIFGIEKSYGMNFIRFHSWCPPDAAFTAADEEGIMIQAEGPRANAQVGKDPKADDFSEKELTRIIQTYGNHPSFCLMSIGNEFGGTADILTHWVDMLKQSDPRHLYSSASYGQATDNVEWVETSKGRGIHGPGTMSDASIAVTKWKVPHLGHEVGQWTFYPDFDEMRKYTGVLKPDNFALVRDDLIARGMGDEGHAFFEATGHEAALLYKEEIENMLRTPGIAGFSLLDMHDYPGQGTALIGILDPFWDSKGFVLPETHKDYCGAVVPLLQFPKRTYATGDTFSAKAEIAQFGSTDLNNVTPEWKLLDKSGTAIETGTLGQFDLPTGKLSTLGNLSIPLDKASGPAEYTVTLSFRRTSYANSWSIWVYPPANAPAPPPNLVISHAWDDPTRAALDSGKRVLLLPPSDPAHFLKGSFTPVFWSPIWFHRNPASMGILCDLKSALFAGFPTESYTNWQWWNLIQGSQTMVLNDTPADFRPLVQVIDNFARNQKLGNVIEAKVGKGSLLICTLNLSDPTLPESSAFLKSLYAYAGHFAPSQRLDADTITKILSVQTPMGGAPAGQQYHAY
jgi:hypothetical protein